MTYKKATDNPNFPKFIYNLRKKKKTLSEFARDFGYTRNGIYEIFKYDRKKLIESIFEKLK